MEPQRRPDDAETILDGLHRASRPAATPERIGAYRVESRLGIGGMGEVFLAWDEKLQRRVAIKRIRRDIGLSPEQRERFRREARLAARLSHPNVVQIHDLISEGEDDAIVMELIEGRTLEERLASERLEMGEVLRLACEIAKGLAAAHEAGLVHRDLKAANVLVTPSGDAKILDFGLARPIVRSPEEQGFTRQGVILGTCHAMSPEQARGEEVDQRSDLFSFGSLLHEMLTGRPPFRGNDPIDSLRRVVTEEPVDPRLARPDLPAEAARLLRRLLAKNRDDRPASAREVIEILERLRTAPSGAHTAALEGSVGGFSSGAATQLELPEPLYGDTRGALSLGWTRRLLLLAGAAAALVIVGAVALFLVVSSVPRSNVRDEDWRAFVLIQKRVNDGEALREDLTQLEKSFGTSPDFMEARVLAARIARALFEAQRKPADLEKAAKLIDEAISLFPQKSAPLREAVQIALNRSRIGDAESFLERLKQLDPGNPNILPLRADLAEQQGDLEEAAALLADAVDQVPSWRNRYRLADFEVRHGRIESAREQISKILSQDPGNLWALEQQGQLELLYGDDLERAELIYQGLVRSVPERAYANLGAVRLLRGQTEEAAEAYSRALAIAPDHPPALVNLAEVDLKLGRKREAEELFRHALARLERRFEAEAGLSPPDRQLRARCLARLGRTREAVEILQALSSATADDPWLLYHNAVIYNLAGDRANALVNAKTALDKGVLQRWFEDPDFRWLRESPELRSRFQAEPLSP